jgi:hypothetical protein
MITLDDDFESALDEGAGGNHLVLWYRTNKGRAQAILRFLRIGIDTDEMMAIILPLQELQDTENALIAVGLPVERLMNEGRLLLFASEEVVPREASDCKSMIEAVTGLRDMAAAQGRRLRLVGRVAPLFFERGDIESALAVELAADSSLGQARLLCLYDARSRDRLPEVHGQKIDDAHNHILHETSKGKVTMRKNRKNGPPRVSSKQKKGRSRSNSS